MGEHDRIRRVAERLRSAKCVAVMTGAGVSAESRIPTFRDAMTGLWASFDPQKLATPEAFDADPETVSRWYDFRREKCLEAIPNPGHEAITTMQQRLASQGGQLHVLTQNVDGLHQRAGSTGVVELHGSIMRWRCTKTGARITDLPIPLPTYPMPSASGGLLRPDVVWFGETLPEDALQAAFDAARSCDLFFSVGTSSMVYPAAGFAHLASKHGAMLVEVNPQRTELSMFADVVLTGPSGQVLPEVVRAAFGHTSE